MGAATASSAGTLVYNVGTLFQGTTPTIGTHPTETAPWMTATFSDIAPSGGVSQVQLTLKSNLLNSNEYISEVVFNVASDHLGGSGGLTTSNITYSGTSPEVTDLVVSANNRSLTGVSLATKFDIGIDWSSSSSKRFNGTDSDTFTFKLSGLTASDFNYTNSTGSIHIAALVKGIGVNHNLWGAIKENSISPSSSPSAPVPEPVFFQLGALLGMSGMGILKLRRKA